MDQGAIVALVAAHVAAHVQGTVVAAVPTLVAPGLPAVQSKFKINSKYFDYKCAILNENVSSI